MGRVKKRKTAAENHLQQVITRIQVIDSTVDIFEQRKDLEKKGVWKVIAGMDEERLQEQVGSLCCRAQGSPARRQQDRRVTPR